MGLRFVISSWQKKRRGGFSTIAHMAVELLETMLKAEKKPRVPRVGKSRTPFSTDRIDSHVQCSQENCPHCGSIAIELSSAPGEKWQQAELPEVRAVVTEYELLKYCCKGCGKNSTASLPSGVPDSAFKPKLMGLLATLTGVLHVAKREAIQLIKDLYDVDMGVGSVPNIEERVARALDGVYDRIHKFVMGHRYCTHFARLDGEIKESVILCG